MKNISYHLPHYSGLLGIFVMGLIGLVVFEYDKDIQYAIAISVSVAYVAWGVIHHYIHRDLYPSVVIEYTSVALLGLIIMTGLIANS